MMRQIAGSVLALALSFGSLSTFGVGDAKRGAAEFGQCAACHSLEPDHHLTGLSLAGIVGLPTPRHDRTSSRSLNRRPRGR